MNNGLRILLMCVICVGATNSTPAFAYWNSWDWANFIRALTPPPAPVVVQPAPTVVVIPAPTPAPPPDARQSDRAFSECEVKDYVQYKDEMKVYGDGAMLMQMCQIKA